MFRPLSQRVSLLVVFVCTSFAIMGCGGGARTVTPREARGLMETDTNVVVLDVRTPEEFGGESGHLAGALLIPVQELQQRVGELAPYRKKAVIVYCRSGHRSAQAASMLSAAGFTVLDVEGGIKAWNAANLPVVRDTTGSMR